MVLRSKKNLIQEDRIINELVQRYGTKNWAQIAD
jgi:hypothetical protein